MIITPSYSFTRPANTTQYTAADLVANDATAGSVVPMQWALNAVGSKGCIRRVRLFKDNQATTAASFAIHLFTESPVVTNGDNGAFAVSTAATYLDKISIDMSSGALVTATDIFKASAATAIFFNLPQLNSRLYGLIEAVGTYTPASAEQFAVALEIEGIR